MANSQKMDEENLDEENLYEENLYLSFDETVVGLSELWRIKLKKDIPASLIDAFKEMKIVADETQLGLTQKLEDFCKFNVEKKLLRVHCQEVPETILPAGYTATLKDIKVFGRCSDDKIYTDNPDIRKMIPRGTTTMQLNGPNKSWLDVITYANKKFIGGIGDDEEDNVNDDTWRQYCLEVPETAKEVICMEKLNGDGAHLSGRFIDGKFYYILGSKNAHIIIRKKEQIDLYKIDRYEVARRFANTIWDTVQSLGQRERHLLLNLLHHTKTTASFEVFQPEYQHIVDLSHLQCNQLNLILFTPTVMKEETTFTAFPPHHALDLGTALGFISAPYSITTHDLVEERCLQIRAEIHSEGKVLYYLNQKGATFGIAKVKTTWYILLRAIREKAVYTFITKRKRRDYNFDDQIQSTLKRISTIQKWLNLSENCTGKWKEIGEAYLVWMEKEIDENRIDPKNIQSHYPIWWKRFMEETDTSENIPFEVAS